MKFLSHGVWKSQKKSHSKLSWSEIKFNITYRTLFEAVHIQFDGVTFWNRIAVFNALFIGDVNRALKGSKMVQLHGVWKSQKMSHSTMRAKRTTFTFWVDKDAKNAQFGEFWKMWILLPNSVTRQVNFKIGQKLVEIAEIEKFKCDILSNFQTMWNSQIRMNMFEIVVKRDWKDFQCMTVRLGPIFLRLLAFWDFFGLFETFWVFLRLWIALWR